MSDASMTQVPNAEKIVAVHADRPAEHLFFAQYRHWMAGYATGDILAWDSAWDSLLKFVPFNVARILYAEFHLFARGLTEAVGMRCGWRPDVCRCLCRDEYFILMLVGGSQRDDVEAEALAVAALAGGDHPALAIASRRLAETLKRFEIIFAPIRNQSAPARVTSDGHTMH